MELDDTTPDDWPGMPSSIRSRRRRMIVLGACSVVLLAAVLGGGRVWVRYHDDWAFKRLANSASQDCDPSIRRFGKGERKGFWPDATRYSVAYCGGELALGPDVDQARFPTAAAEQRDLLADAPSDATCVAGLVVYTNGLDPGQFPVLCRHAHGHLVDVIEGLPEVPEAPPGKYPTQDSVEHAVAVEQRRNSALQRRALATYFAHR